MNDQTFVVVALLFFALTAHAQRTDLPPTSTVLEPYVKNGVSVFGFEETSTEPTKPSAYRYDPVVVESLLTAGAPKLSIQYTHLRSDMPGYFSARYRLIYITKPLVARAINGPYPNFPPFNNAPRSEIFFLGVLDEDHATAPKRTEWLKMSDFRVKIEKE